jgi:hypothetical protein
VRPLKRPAATCPSPYGNASRLLFGGLGRIVVHLHLNARVIPATRLTGIAGVNSPVDLLKEDETHA